MKIAQIVSYQESVPPNSKNGLEFVVSWITEELLKRGHEVTLFAPGDSKTKASLKSIYPTNLSNAKKVLWYHNDYNNQNLSYAFSMADKFDIIHTHTNPNLFVGFTKKPVVHTLHSPYRDGFRKMYLTNKKISGYIKPIIDNYEKINYVTISKLQQKNYRKCEKYYFKNYTNIYNGIPVEKFKFNDKPEDYLFFMGYISEDKGAHIAVKVAKKTKQKLILAGQYSERHPEYFNKYIKPYLNENIQYVGPVNFKQKIKLLKNAKAVINPITWDEPFGLVPVEAQACGTPVLTFKKGAMPEIVKNNKTGYVVETEKELMESIKKIDKIDRYECRKWVEENFSVEKMVDEYEKLYKKLINKKK